MIALICLVAVCSTIAAATPISTPDDLSNLAVANVKVCGPLHHQTDDQIAKLHHPDDIAKIEPDTNVMCFMKCLYDRSPITEGGVLNVHNFEANLRAHDKDTTNLRKVFGTCSKLYSTGTDCADLWKMFLCFEGLKY